MGGRRPVVGVSRAACATPAGKEMIGQALLAILLGTVSTLLAVVPARATWAQPAEYSGAEIRARVIDIETLQPLEGVMVVARWELDQTLSRETRPLQAMETVTDAIGHFYFPPWGPRPRPPFTRLWGGDPRLTFFKPGYLPMTRGNPLAPDDSAVRVSQLHGQTIAAKRFQGTVEQWASVLSVLQTTLDWGAGSHDVPYRVNDYWKHYPRIVLAILEERNRIPEPLRYQVRDVRTWEVTEEKLRAAARGNGGSR
jgi:hypothetical protein